MNKKVMVFIHGGPGLSSSYFKGWFDYLEDICDVLFYDQDYTNCTPGNAIEVLSDELISKLEELMPKYEEIEIYAHSWGTFLLLKAIGKIRNSLAWPKIGTIILSNPADLNWTNYQESGEHLFDNMPEDEIDAITNCTDGLEMMRIALPYYVADKENVPPIIIDRYDLDAYEIIDNEMNDYDVTESVDLLPLERTHTIYCEFDFEKQAGSEKLCELSCFHYFENAGHFPFAEQPERYETLIRKILA